MINLFLKKNKLIVIKLERTCVLLVYKEMDLRPKINLKKGEKTKEME